VNTGTTSALRFYQADYFLPVFLFFSKIPVITFFLLSFSLEASAGPDLRSLVFEPKALTNITEIHESGVSALEDADTQLAISTQNIPQQNPVTDFSHYLHDPFNNIELDVDYSTLIEKQLKELNNHIYEEGPYGQSLEKDLGNLAHLQQDAGEFAEARKTLERMLQISKINKGLFHEEQIPIAEAYVKTLIALGDYNKVDEQLGFLVYLYQKCFGADSPEIIKPLADKVAWDMHLYKLSAYESKTAVNSNALTGNYASHYQLENDEFGILSQTQDTIVKAIQILVKARDFDNPFLIDFEQQLIATYFYQARANGMVNHGQHLVTNLQGSYISVDPYDFTMANFLNGEQSYQRLLGYMERSGQGSSFSYVEVAIGLGDWYMLFGKRQRGLDQYQKVQTILEAGDFTAQEKQTLLNPPAPSPLPAFNNSAFVATSARGTGDMAHGYMGYIDVAFEVSRFGRVKNLETLGSSPQTPRNVVTTLEWEIRDTQYRPILVSDDGPGSRQFYIRYYYNY